MALKNLKNIVTGLGSKYQGANQGPACCGSKASWENVFGGGGISPDPPPGCCADLGDNIPYFGVSIENPGSDRLTSNSWTCPPIDCRMTLSFFPTGYNLENDPAATIYVVINGLPNQINWGQWNDFTINSGDQIYFQFDHTADICNQADITINNVTCSTNYGTMATLYFGDPACVFCPGWDLSSIYERGIIAQTPVYTNTTNQTQGIQIVAGILNWQFTGECWIEVNGTLYAYLVQNGISYIHNVFLNPYDQMVIFVQETTGKCFIVEIQMENVTCGYSVGMISEIMVNSGNC